MLIIDAVRLLFVFFVPALLISVLAAADNLYPLIEIVNQTAHPFVSLHTTMGTGAILLPFGMNRCLLTSVHQEFSAPLKNSHPINPPPKQSMIPHQHPKIGRFLSCGDETSEITLQTNALVALPPVMIDAAACSIVDGNFMSQNKKS